MNENFIGNDRNGQSTTTGAGRGRRRDEPSGTTDETMQAQLASDVVDNGSSHDVTTPCVMDAEKRANRRPYRMSATAMVQRRAAAKKSTGPKTAAGKSRSSRNSLTHGMTAFRTAYLVVGEDRAAYDELYQALLRRYRPLDPTGAWAMRQLANAFWRQAHRIDVAEAALITEERERQSRASMWFNRLRFGKAEDRSLLGEELAELAEEMKGEIDLFDEESWQVNVRPKAVRLAREVPELAPFCTAEATHDTAVKWYEAVLSAFRRVEQQEASGDKEQARRARERDIALVSYGPGRDILRYTASNDRRIRMLVELIEAHCVQRGDQKAPDAEDRAEQNEPNWERPAASG